MKLNSKDKIFLSAMAFVVKDVLASKATKAAKAKLAKWRKQNPTATS